MRLWAASLCVKEVGDVSSILPTPWGGSHLSPPWRTPSPASYKVPGAGPISTLLQIAPSCTEEWASWVQSVHTSGEGTHPGVPIPTYGCPTALSRAQAPVSAPGCCRKGGKREEKHHRLLLWQRFQRRFWLPLRSVRNLILSACGALSACLPQRAPQGRALGAGSWVRAKASGGNGAPQHQRSAPAPRQPQAAGMGSRTGSRLPHMCPPHSLWDLRIGGELGQTWNPHQSLGCSGSAGFFPPQAAHGMTRFIYPSPHHHQHKLRLRCLQE